MTQAQRAFQAGRARELRRKMKKTHVLHNVRTGFSYFLGSKLEGEALKEFTPGFRLLTIGTFIKNMEA